MDLFPKHADTFMSWCDSAREAVLLDMPPSLDQHKRHRRNLPKATRAAYTKSRARQRLALERRAAQWLEEQAYNAHEQDGWLDMEGGRDGRWRASGWKGCLDARRG